MNDLRRDGDTRTGADTTFEPTIDMMVNDFDDEQTLNEEEALAAAELQDPQDEIATLQEESEMPIEQLLAKYSVMPPMEIQSQNQPPPQKKSRKSAVVGEEIAKRKNVKKHKKITTSPSHPTTAGQTAATVAEPIAVHSADEKNAECGQLDIPYGEMEADVIVIESGDEDDGGGGEDATTAPKKRPLEKKIKLRRSHLFDLYPEQTFAMTATVHDENGEKVLTVENFYDEDDDEEDDEVECEGDEEETEASPDYVKKTIMVGSPYQAVIPDGLSQYGDVLPYENEDKLIWEPSQVSEHEVEQYLLRAREIRPTLSASVEDDAAAEAASDEGATTTADNEVRVDDENATEKDEMTEENSTSMNESKRTVSAISVSSTGETEVCASGGVVKDSEQALHLLVQCGYDFKEALRRKRLNAVPLTGSMSLWSEEECHKFEEGIQKFGKDFLKIRQNQVRTRTMRELVQFYYLWKKSERRDHDIANSDTVDHMDMYLNESGDYSSNAVAAAPVAVAGAAPGQMPGTAPNAGQTQARKTATCCSQKNFSIMTGGNAGCSSTTSIGCLQAHATAAVGATNSSATSNAKATPSRRRGVSTMPGTTSLAATGSNPIAPTTAASGVK